MPFWAGMLTEEQHPHEELNRAIRQASWDLYFRTNPVCDPPSFVADPGLDLDTLLDGQPILVLQGSAGNRVRKAKSLPVDANGLEPAKAIRAQMHQSWINIIKASRGLQGLDFEPFGTRNVESSAKTCVRRIHRETGWTYQQIERFALEQA